MLREQDITIRIGRAEHGGDCMELVHVPTGIARAHPGPLRKVNRHKLLQKWLIEIENELKERGLAQHVLAEYRTKSKRQRRR